MPDQLAPLSLESAAGMLTEKPAPVEKATPEKVETPVTEQPKEDKPEKAAVEGADAASPADEDSPEGDEGDTQEGDEEPGDDALPPIDAPTSWSKEDKAAFAKLDRDAQEIIHRREQQRDTELRKLQNSSADYRKSAEAKITQLETLTAQIGEHLNSEMAGMARDFPELRTEADLILLAQNDPARFSAFQARLMQFQMKQQVAAQAQTELQKRQETEQQERINKAAEGFVEYFPKWKTDPELAKKELVELQDYAISQGANEAAARQNFDPIIYRLARKAKSWDDAQEAKAKALKNAPPRVVKPGTSNTDPKHDKAQARQKQMDKLKKSGDLEDARGLLRM